MIFASVVFKLCFAFSVCLPALWRQRVLPDWHHGQENGVVPRHDQVQGLERREDGSAIHRRKHERDEGNRYQMENFSLLI